MSKEVEHNRPEVPLPEPDDDKLRYERPTVRSEGVFETMALSCGKVNVSQAQCAVNLNAS